MGVLHYDTTAKGDTDRYDAPWLAVYDTSCVYDGYLNKAYDWAINYFNYAYNENFLSGFTVEKRAITDWCPSCSGDVAVVNQWDNHRNDLDLTHDGGHALIHSCSTDGSIARGTNSGDNVWETDNSIVACTDEGNRRESEVAGTVLHEFGHCGSRSSECPNVSDMHSGNEHQLGIITSQDCGDAASPLAGNTSAGNGQCDTKSGELDCNTYKPSLCEMSALEESAEHTAGFHDCSGCT
jgi:hypothetical protein